MAKFAPRLFGHPFTGEAVIEETLETFTESGAPSRAELTASLARPVPDTIEAFRRDALARRVEAGLASSRKKGAAEAARAAHASRRRASSGRQ